VGGQGSRRLNGVRPDLLFDPQRKSPAASNAGAAGTGRPWWEYAVVAVLLLAAGGAAVVFVLRRRGRAPLEPLDRAVWELELALRRAGRPLTTGTTLRQLEQRFGGGDEGTAYIRTLSASRYGPAARLPSGEERRKLRRALAQGLGPLGRLRAFWALPPRR
jgi:hypothetical protein